MDRQHAHQLLDSLDAAQLDAISRLLEVMVDPVAAALQKAPADDEPVTDEDRRRFQRGQAWFEQRGGPGVAMEEVMAGFGAKPEDFR